MGRYSLLIRRRGAQFGVSLAKRRAWFDDAPPAGTDAAKPTPEPGKEPDKTGTPQGKTEGQADKPQMLQFTQERLDELFNERAAKAKKSTEDDLLKALGVENLDALKSVVTAHNQAQEASKSELQKVSDRAEKAETKLAEVQKQLADERAGRTRDRLEYAVKSAAKGAEHPEDVWLWLNNNMADDLAKAVGEDGKVDEKAIKPLIEKVKTARPYFFGAQQGRTPGSPSVSGGKPPAPDADKALGSKPLVRL